MAVHIKQLADEVVGLEGVLDGESVPSILPAAKELLEKEQQLIVDLERISYSDSSGLALLLQWLQHARDLNKGIQFRNMPQQMRDIASVTGLLEVLPIIVNNELA